MLQEPYKVTARKSLTPPWERNLKLVRPPVSIKISPKTTPQPSPRQSPRPSPKQSPKSSPQFKVSPKVEQESDQGPAVPKAEPLPDEMESKIDTEVDNRVAVAESIVIKTSPKSSPASSTRSPKSSPLIAHASPDTSKTEEFFREIDAKFADTPAVAVTKKSRLTSFGVDTAGDSSDAAKTTKQTRKYEIPVIKQEIVEQVPDQTPSTPTRNRRTRRESSAEVMTPTRSSRRLKEKEENQQVEAKTPTRSTRKGKKDENMAITPTRLRGKKVKEELESIEQIKAETTKPFSNRAKEVVNESLKQLAEDMELTHEVEPESPIKHEVKESSDMVKDKKSKGKHVSRRSKDEGVDQMEVEEESPFPVNQKEAENFRESVEKLTEEALDTIWEREQRSPDDSSPSRLTRIKTRDRDSMSPGPSKFDRSIQAAVTPTRSSRRLAEKENEENTAKTPTRGRRGRKTIDTGQSPAVESKSTDKLITPFRGRKKKEEHVTELPVIQESKSPSHRKIVSPAKNESENKDIVEASQTPTRGRRKKKDETLNETGEVSVIETGAQTPTRGRRKKADSLSETSEVFNETGALTPTRRSSRLRKESVDLVELTPSRRRQSFSQADINFNNSEFTDTDSDGPRTRRRSFGRADNVQNIRRQSFSKSEQSKDEILKGDGSKGRSSRRHTISGSGFKVDHEKLSSEFEKITSRKISPVRENTDIVTPATTPSRRGRPRKKEVSPIIESTEEEGTEPEIKPDKGTPSRKGRGRKLKEKKEDIEVETDKLVEQSKNDKEMGTDAMEENDKLGSEPEGEVEELKSKSTPSRSKRQKMEKHNVEPPGSPEKEMISHSFAALVEGEVVLVSITIN